jgi:hypothetical protein
LHHHLIEMLIEHGLSVSLESSPRTPSTPRATTTEEEEACYAPPPRKPSFARLMAAEIETTVAAAAAAAAESGGEVSISPRVLFSGIESSRRVIRRNLSSEFIFDSSCSPVSFGSSSSSSSIVKYTEQTECIGECGVCYSQLPLYANHVFTMCGHLFCLRCLLKWWDNSTTCPICRAELFADDPADHHHPAEVAAEEGVAEEEVWMRREFWNGRVDHFVDSDGEEHHNNNNDDGSSGSSSSSSSSSMSPLPRVRVSSRLYRYIHQDTELDWSRNGYGSIYVDDTLNQHINEYEIQALQENRDIAMTLFARARFREMLFDSMTQFTGSLSEGHFVPKNEWIGIAYNMAYHTRLYEFVIRRGSEISPLFEVNLFGFIKDVGMNYDGYNSDDVYEVEWEEYHEYVFVADVFTPTDFYIGTNALRSYGGYNMQEGTITTQELAIPFSQIRRLYRICGGGGDGHEPSED